MKLEYNIIWAEDKINDRPFVSLASKVKQHLEEHFFKANVVVAEDVEDFKNIINNDQTYDLVITDLNLNESFGTEIINFVRTEKHIHTEVFFYSANDLHNQKLINSNRITFYQLTGKDYHSELGNEIISLIDLTINKFQDIISMRGMIMHETSSLDMRMEKIVLTFLNDHKIVDKIFPLIQENMIKHNREKYERLSAGNPNKIFKDTVLFNSSQRIFAIGLILDLLELSNFSNDYLNEIVDIRNKFAHADLQKNENSQSVFKSRNKEIVFDMALCKKIRRDIIKHGDHISKLEEKLSQMY